MPSRSLTKSLAEIPNEPISSYRCTVGAPALFSMRNQDLLCWSLTGRRRLFTDASLNGRAHESVSLLSNHTHELASATTAALARDVAARIDGVDLLLRQRVVGVGDPLAVDL